MQVYPETNRTWREAFQYYRGLRLSNLTSPAYRHLLLLLLYWPVYGLAFFLVERVLPLQFHPVVCSWDAYIPFCEYFILPYWYWFVYLIGMVAYTLLFNIPAFRRCMWFIMITYSVTILIYLIYPTMQELRPEVLPRDNIFARAVAGLYAFDTNTNVCPSIHVLGSVAACLAGLQCQRFSTPGRRTFLIVSAFLISISTVFLKQHSLVDVIVAVVLCAVAYPVVYCRRRLGTDGAEKPEAVLTGSGDSKR